MKLIGSRSRCTSEQSKPLFICSRGTFTSFPMCRLQPSSSSTYCTAGVDRCPVATLGSVSKTCRATPSCWQTAEVGVFNNSPLRLPRLFCFRPSPFHIHHSTSTPPSYSTCNGGASDRSDIGRLPRLRSPPEKTITLLQSDVASSFQTP